MLLPADNTEITMARTPKARALGAALRQAREDKGLVLREVAAAISRDIGVLSRWETGERSPKPEQVAQILTKLEVDSELYDEIMTLAYRTNESQWVATSLPEQKQQMVAYVDWEQNATKIVEVAPLLIPGLLQTRDYIHAIMTTGRAPIGEIASRVTSRIGRRDVIDKPRPAHLLVLLGQAALNQEIGGRKAMIEQIRHLLKMAAQPNVELRVVPDHRDWHPGLEGAFTFIEARRAAIKPESIVFVGTRRSVLMLHENDDVDAYKAAIDRIKEAALSADASVKLVADIGKRMERKGDSSGHVAEVAS
ncbi:MAG TPA: helix-turn-helix transcriptional regulator [Pseudonocardiaceae bacterium]|jgi:transcriptional regulator with XRE-family HTH domain|nr:helix-turn-helix transcriptional regulator [Pseudonocardiaceae bacterium]